MLLLLAGCVVATRADAVGAEPAERSLAERLDGLLAHGALAQARVGIHVERLSDGGVVYDRGGDQLFIPASNQKILTVLAALAHFGPTHRFTTRVLASAAIDGEGAVSQLVVEGGGDPALTSEDWWRIAADLRREGLRTVEGDLVVDDSRFAGPAWHPSWGAISANAYHAPIGALSANFGAFTIAVRPRTSIGSPARVALDPPVEYFRLRNLARTVGRRARPRLHIERMPGAVSEGLAEEIVRVEGRVRVGDPGDQISRAVLDPGLYAGSLLLHQLRAIGVDVAGRVQRRPASAADHVVLLEWRGRSLAEIARLCMKHSSNSIAETLVKDLAIDVDPGESALVHRAGDWARGIAAMRRSLEALGIDLERATLVDGSGLSLQNRLSPKMLVEALRLAQQSFRAGPELVASLPIAHQDGTLERRLAPAEGRIRAKTGLLSDAGVTALSGYVDREDGERLAFSILVNGKGAGTEAAMRGVDHLALVLLEGALDPRPAEGVQEGRASP